MSLRRNSRTTMESRDIFTFFQESLPSKTFSVLRDLKRRRQLCDVTITVQDRSFLAHRVVLAAAIPYFRVMFTSDRIESKARKLDLKIVEANALESLIDFAYCSKLKITTENARSLLFASAFLKMEQVQEACSTFLEKRLGPHNVMDIRSLADSLTCKKLVESCDRYVKSTFEEISISPASVGPKFHYLKELTDDLQVTKEEKVYEAVSKCVKCSSTDRASLLPEIPRNVRMSQFASKYSAEHVTDAIIQKSVSYHPLTETKDYPKWKSHLNTQPRQYIGPPEDTVPFSYCVGMYCVSYSDTLGCIVRNCDPEKMKWTMLVTNNQCTNVTHVVAVNTDIYVFAIGSLKTLDVKTLQWTPRAPCPASSPGNNVISHSQTVYCFGASKIWSFDKVRNKWHTDGHMLQIRFRAGSVSLGDYIYLFGGLENESDCFSAQDSMERYDLQTKISTNLSPMLKKRWGHASAAENNKIYALGGYRIGTFLFNDAEVYDCLAHQWTSIQSMTYSTHPFSSVVHNEKLYAVGARALGERNLVVQIYDPGADKWTFGDPLPFEDGPEEVKGLVIISNIKTVKASSGRRLDKPGSHHVPVVRRNSRQSFSKS